MFLKVISMDLEMLPLGDQMPNPQYSPIILASMHFNWDYEFEGKTTRNLMYVLTRNYENIEVRKERIVVFSKHETLLLNGLFDAIKKNDILTGYNIGNFDVTYFLDRARELKIRNISLGLGDKTSYYRKHLSKGFSITKIGGLTGKILIDVLGVLRREDATNIFKREYNLKKLTLEHVSKEILGIEKKEFSIYEMHHYWENTDNVELRDKFIDYCSRDSELALLFLTKFRLLDKFFSLSKASGKLVQDVINSQGSGIMVENLLLKEFRKYDRVMPIRTHKESGFGGEDEEELGGAFVLPPKVGISEDIVIYDYTSLYPSLMIRWNLCYSTLVLESDLSKLGLTENDVVHQIDENGIQYATFVKKEVFKGIVPRKLEELLALRKHQKGEMKKYQKNTPEYLMFDSSQNATKILLNSFYGYTGDTTSKVYSWYVASAVTTNGRKQIKVTINTIKNTSVEKDGMKYRLEVVASDTDSTYVNVIRVPDIPVSCIANQQFCNVNTLGFTLGFGNKIEAYKVSREEAIFCGNYAADKVNSTLEKPMNLAYDGYIRRMFIGAKKRYAYLSVDDNGKENITSKGLETIRRDWCNFSTDNMEKVIDFILKEKNVKDGIDKGIKLVQEQAKLLEDGKVDINDLVLSKKLTKLITLYDNKAVHAMVAIKMKERGHASEVGDRIQYLILNNGKKLISEKAEEADYVIRNLDKFKIDNKYYIHKQLIPPIMRVLELLGVKEEVLVSSLNVNQKKLTEWF